MIKRPTVHKTWELATKKFGTCTNSGISANFGMFFWKFLVTPLCKFDTTSDKALRENNACGVTYAEISSPV